jgi:SMODS and SLOG-associating 2TM effector domain 2
MNNTQEASSPGAPVVQRTLSPATKQPDIECPDIRVQDLAWGTPEEARDSIKKLYEYAEAVADTSIYWYGCHKRKIAWKSRLLRLFAIIFTALGGLTPIISSLGWSIQRGPGVVERLDFGQLGYLFLGLAAACVGLDRFFGFSSGWMRYITTKMTLERALSDFRFEWAMMAAMQGKSLPASEQIQQMIQRVKEFSSAINTHVDQETQSWVSEFKTNIAEIEKTAKAQAEAARPGAIEVIVQNGMETDSGFTVTLDGMRHGAAVRGTKYHIGYLSPGPHMVVVEGTIEGEPLDASEYVNVLPGEVVKASLSLPVKEAQP